MAKGKSKGRKNKNLYRLIGVVLVMVLFGLIMVLSASSAKAFDDAGNSFFYFKKQLISVLLGIMALLFFSKFPVRSLQKLAPLGMFAAIVMLAAVLVPGVGNTVAGSSRWIPVAGFNMQPSEFAKVAVAIYTADFLTRRKIGLTNIKDLIYPYGVCIGLVVFLVMLQPDLGTTLSICLIAFAMIFIAGLHLKYVAGIGLLGLTSGALLIALEGYRLERFLSFLNPEADPSGSGYQIKQSLIALGSGGLFGVGFGLSRQKLFYLPAAHTDFIFAIIGEELGLLGTLFTVSLFAAFAYFGIKISFQCKNLFGRLLGAGLTSMVVLQAFINMGAVTASLPITGIPMPFISYGGSSLIVNLASVGILLSVAINNDREALALRRNERKERVLYLVENKDIKAGRSNKQKRKTKKKAANMGTSTGLSKRKIVGIMEQKGALSTDMVRVKRTKSRGTEVNASDNKRRRNSRSRLSGTGSRQRVTKDGRES